MILHLLGVDFGQEYSFQIVVYFYYNISKIVITLRGLTSSVHLSLLLFINLYYVVRSEIRTDQSEVNMFALYKPVTSL